MSNPSIKGPPFGFNEEAPRARAWGDAIRFAAATALLFDAWFGVIQLSHSLVAGFRAGSWAILGWDILESGGLWLGFMVLPIGGFIALALGKRTLAMVLAGTVVLTQVLLLIMSSRQVVAGFLSPVWLLSQGVAVAVHVLLLLGLLAFHPQAPRLDGQLWLRVFGIGAAVAAAWSVVRTLEPEWSLSWLDPRTVVLVVAGLLHFRSTRSGRMQPRPDRTLALALLAAALGLFLGAGFAPIITSFMDMDMLGARYLVGGFLQLAVIAILGVVLAVTARRELETLPA